MQWYDSVNIADRLVFRWLAIPWLQKEADSYVYNHNTTRRRANRHKVLPNGVPDVMFENPETVNALDFKVIVPDTLIKDAESRWAPPTDPVFDLIPPDCEEHISSTYAQLGSPEVSFRSFWKIYNQLRSAVDSETLLQAGIGTSDDDIAPTNTSIDQRPLSHLRPCEFGEDGIPAGISCEELPAEPEPSEEESDTLQVEFTDDRGDEMY